MSVAGTTLLWTIFLTFELRVFVISGTIAQVRACVAESTPRCSCGLMRSSATASLSVVAHTHHRFRSSHRLAAGSPMACQHAAAWACLTAAVMSTQSCCCLLTLCCLVQWYFAPPGLASTKGSTMLSIRHAFANHFGSLCLGSAILTVVQMARQAAEQ